MTEKKTEYVQVTHNHKFVIGLHTT